MHDVTGTTANSRTKKEAKTDSSATAKRYSNTEGGRIHGIQADRDYSTKFCSGSKGSACGLSYKHEGNNDVNSGKDREATKGNR